MISLSSFRSENLEKSLGFAFLLFVLSCVNYTENVDYKVISIPLEATFEILQLLRYVARSVECTPHVFLDYPALQSQISEKLR